MYESIIEYIVKYHIGDFTGIIGLIITIIGFFVTIITVIKSKNAATLTEETVKKVREDLRLYQTVNRFSSALVTMDEIKRLHRQKEWILLPDRYNNLRKSLIAVRCENPILSEDDQKEIQAAIAIFAGLEILIDKHLSSDDQSKIDIPTINGKVSKQIDRIQELLVKLNSKVGVEQWVMKK